MCRNGETEKRRARGRETAERASVVKRYIDISRLIVLAISHARALRDLAKKTDGRKKTIPRSWTRPDDVSISLACIPQIVAVIIVVIAGDRGDVGLVTRLHDATQHVRDRRRGQSARRSDRLRFPRRRKTAAIHAPLLFGILEVRPGDGMVYAVPFRATLGRS